ncbi:hypothetical protein K501DRAFT_277624 [Backusella circina FSU 941]|nr:hypothetical protein K501DRAFT_277624 [Backusella circina FSU 941]
MCMKQASLMVNMLYTTAYFIYQRYTLDPNHRILLSHNQPINGINRCTPEQATTLSHCIVNGKITICLSSIRTNISHTSGIEYYLRYLDGPNYTIPNPTLNRSSFLLLRRPLRTILADQLFYKPIFRGGNTFQNWSFPLGISIVTLKRKSIALMFISRWYLFAVALPVVQFESS